ncbi:nucleoside-specific channel-forming Tsx family protein [Vibrio sp. SCSIO 43137]|uniref:nucleoside-specific channel-forming Tsx family protein n=1 Tax=Vibrio sp. SCSIO 43137 TaxID=3021011 RepID=UPI002307A58F|nr:outer membrane protein OmpK [Vibrio sp. SCSIO 43137]WCE30777.1 outer membrane protein OmpK [Vibrio sp. SCSIO 43137]
MKNHILTLCLGAAVAGGALSGQAVAADYTDGDIHKNDYKWMQFNLMGAFNEKGFTESSHDYLEMEFGGRSGIFDLYGYVDVFNLTSDSNSDKNGAEKIFMKFAPRVSLDALTEKDLSFGAVKELYISTLMEWGGNSNVNNQKIGLGADVELPWLGKVGVNLYRYYNGNDKKWDGYQLSANWFKPFYFFDNGSFLSYQGYFDYQFAMDDKPVTKTSRGGAMFHGLYWHSERYALGYGLKAYDDVFGLKDGALGDKPQSSGIGHYIAATYKF